MEMMPGFSTAKVKDKIDETLRLFVGRGRFINWAELAEATGSGDAEDNRRLERRLRSYVEPDGPVMPLDVFVRVFAVLPPEAFARMARYMGFAAAPVDQIDETATVRRVLADAARLVADGNEFLDDGILNHTERAKLADRAMALLPGIQALADTGAR